MKLYFHEAPAGNFGDDLSPWLFSRAIPDWPELADDTHCIFGVGTILTEGNLSKFVKPIVFGSGGTYKTIPRRDILDRCHFICVRGPLTRELFGLPEGMPLGDPAIYLPRLMAPSVPGGSGKTVFIPHHLTLVGALGAEVAKAVETELAVEIVSPRQDFQTVIDSIRGAERVITESLHGAIIADAFRVPWRVVALSPMFNSFKWRDWGRSVGIDADLHKAFSATNFAATWLRKITRRTGLLRNVELDWRKDGLYPRDRVRDEILRVIGAALQAPPQLSAQSDLEARMDDFERSIRLFRETYAG
jgi:succinoglycan biosynthesis protein ExoV